MKESSFLTLALGGVVFAWFFIWLGLYLSNNASIASQFSANDATIYALQTQVNASHDEIVQLQNEVNSLLLGTMNTSVTVLQNGTFEAVITSAVNSPTYNGTTSTYRLLQVQIGNGAATFVVLELDPPADLLYVPLAAQTETGGGYNVFAFQFQTFDPQIDMLNTLGNVDVYFGGAVWIPLSTANADQLQITPDCVSSGECMETGVAQYTFQPNQYSLVIYGPGSPVPSLPSILGYYMSTTNSPSYDFVGSSFGLKDTLKLVLPVL
jgi:hypothetical protein